MTAAAAGRPVLFARVLTAGALLAAFVAGLFLLTNSLWSVLTLAVVVLGGREWAALAGWSRLGQGAYCGLLLALAGALQGAATAEHQWLEPGVYAAACLFWTAAVPSLLAGARMPRHPAAMGLAGIVVLLPAWLAIARLQENPPLLLALLAVVWLADSAAYFAGRAWGRRKLAPRISPGKTWEGVAGAVAAVAVYYLFLSFSYSAREWVGTVRGAVLLAGIVTLSIVGDLFESWAKRRAGVKDSGRLLPGHGGVLDRIDGLVAAMPLAGLLLRYPA